MKRHTKPFFSSSKAEKPKGCVAERLHTQYSVYRDQWRLAFECSEFMISGGEALTYNATHVLYNLLPNPECMNRVRTELSMLNLEYDEVWRDLGVVDLPYLVIMYQRQDDRNNVANADHRMQSSRRA